MDPQVPTENSPTVTPLPNNHLVTILSTLLIIAGMIATFFYFQVQKLSKELAKYKASAIFGSTPRALILSLARPIRFCSPSIH